MRKLWKNWGNVIFFWGVFSVYLALTLFLFHRQSVGYGGRYLSDMGSYIGEIEGVSSGYSFPYPVMFWIAEFFNLFTPPSRNGNNGDGVEWVDLSGIEVLF